jgi:hypothetical protein
VAYYQKRKGGRKQPKPLLTQELHPTKENEMNSEEAGLRGWEEARPADYPSVPRTQLT